MAASCTRRTATFSGNYSLAVACARSVEKLERADLASQFLSPLHNRRTDRYAGNTFEGRSRIIFDILDKIDQYVPDKKFVRSIKINSQDFAKGGFECVLGR